MAIVKTYLNELKNIDNISFLDLNYTDNISHIFVIKVSHGKRDALRNFLTTHYIQSGIHWPPNHLLTKYKTPYSLPVTEKIYDQILTLPCQCDLTKEAQSYVISTIKRFFNP